MMHCLLPPVYWCTETDVFKIRINAKCTPQTRQGILSFVSFLSPVILPAKNDPGNVVGCGRKVSWDESIPDELSEITNVAFWSDKTSWFHIRSLKPPGFGTVAYAQFHHFAAVSEERLWSCFLPPRQKWKKGNSFSFIISKSRVSPLKRIIILGLELQACWSHTHYWVTLWVAVI